MIGGRLPSKQSETHCTGIERCLQSVLPCVSTSHTRPFCVGRELDGPSSAGIDRSNSKQNSSSTQTYTSIHLLHTFSAFYVSFWLSPSVYLSVSICRVITVSVSISASSITAHVHALKKNGIYISLLISSFCVFRRALSQVTRSAVAPKPSPQIRLGYQ